MERQFLASGKRKTDFEVTDTQKRNPTIISLRPVPTAPAYDPLPAFRWSIAQLERVAHGGDVDPRIDAETADMIAGLARPPKEDAYKRFWINGAADPVVFNEDFGASARSVAARRRAESVEPEWFSGVSQGAVTGELKALDDLQGDRRFVVVPSLGPEQIECHFPEHMRDKIGAYAFKAVRVTGLLTYSSGSPFPMKVDMHDIERIAEPAKHLFDLEGLFAGYAKPEVDYTTWLNG
jgi:hypothetical protein